ncbi:MAG TPA: TM2 domain-containing protein [Rhizomicrobium sp.]
MAANEPGAPERRAAGANEQYCRGCGTIISTLANACPRCGAPTGTRPAGASPKSRLVALLLCFFFGLFGIHRFYVGKIGTGVLQLLTVGGLGIWACVDFILIILGEFTDKERRRLLVWTD